jgi:hypothetical protein
VIHAGRVGPTGVIRVVSMNPRAEGTRVHGHGGFNPVYTNACIPSAILRSIARSPHARGFVALLQRISLRSTQPRSTNGSWSKLASVFGGPTFS